MVGLAACAPTSGPVATRRFSDIRLGVAAAATHEATSPGSAADASAASPVDLATAAARIDAYLKAQDFTAEDRRDGAARVIVATRMAEPGRVDTDAACALQALARPDFSTTTLTVSLSPAPRGVAIAVQSSFAEVKTNLVSGALARESCRSRGVLERGVRRAALGG